MIRTIAIASTILAFAQSPAFAADVAVEFDRDRLGEPAYVGALYDELQDAATTVCRKELSGALLFHARMKACVKYTLAETVERIGAPALTAFADGAAAPATVASRR